jgi:uncharacterized protein (DUF1501 family)
MLTITGDGAARNCAGMPRRDFLRAGALALGGLTLPQLLAMRARSAESGADYVRDKSVVLVFLGGGASHIETFNPNMDAPSPYCSTVGEVQTSLPGVAFGGVFPQLARHADKMAIVRSFAHSVGSHPQAIVHVLSGGTDRAGQQQQGFSMGSAYARIRGANHPATGMPTYAIATAPETDNQYRTERRRIENGSWPGELGASYAPFDPTDESSLANMQLNISADRLSDRRTLLRGLDKLRRQVDARGAMESLDRFEQQAVDLLLGKASEAFDLSKEDPRLVERYDTSGYRVGNVRRRPQLMRNATVGRQMLLARRLCEAGCGFVTVQNAGWDMHADGNNPGITDGMEMLGRPLDKALSAFLEDVEERGLSDKILLIITGDFGRTPKVNTRGGRDHWARLCTLAFAGGGLNMGQVIGQSARNNDEPLGEPVSTPNLLATVMHYLFDMGRLRLDGSLPRDLVGRLEAATPIEALF